MVESEEKDDPTKPTNYIALIKNLITDQRIKHLDNRSYLEYFYERIREDQNVPAFRVLLRDLQSADLIDLFLQEPKDFFRRFRRVLYSELKKNHEINKIIFSKDIEPEYIHIIIDPKGKKDLIPTIDTFSMDLSKYVGKYCIFKGRFMNIGLDRENHFNKLVFRCRMCGHEFHISYPFEVVINRYKPTNKCSKCDSTYTLDIIDDDPFERRLFCVEDLDIKNVGNIITARILRNSKYFIKQEQDIDLNEEIEVYGILWRDYSDYFSRKTNKEFPHYIEVFDIQLEKTKIVNEKIIDVLRKKLQKPTYNEKLIDSMHGLTNLIDLFYPIKLISCLSIVTGGSWNHESNIRDTINAIIAGGGNTYKSSITRSIQKIVGKKNFYRFEGAKITEAGLVGTTERNQDRVKPVIRYGFLALYSNGTICFDEAQELTKDKNMKVLNTLRCLEDGNNSFIQDAVHFSSTCWESVIIAQNYVTENGFYDPGQELYDNLGWNKSNADSLLQRFDLLYNIPKPDVFTKLRVYDNLRQIKEGELAQQIGKDLEISDFEFPEHIKNIKDKIIYVQFNYLMKAKEIYRKAEINKGILNVIEKLYKEAVRLKGFKSSEITMRALNTSYKVLRGLASLRLSASANQRDFNYFKQNCMKLILAFKNSSVVKKEGINIEKAFKQTFKKNVLESLRYREEQIAIGTHIEMIRAYIKTNYFAQKTDEDFDEEINDYMPEEATLSRNWKYRKLLENQKDWLNKLEIEVKTIKRQGTFFCAQNHKLKARKKEKENKKRKLGRGDLANLLEYAGFEFENFYPCRKLYDAVKETFELNNYIELGEKDLIEALEVRTDIKMELIKRMLKFLKNEKILISQKNKKLIFSKKWR